MKKLRNPARWVVFFEADVRTGYVMCTWTFLFWVVSKWLARARCNGTHPMKILGRPRSQGARKDGRVYSLFSNRPHFQGSLNYLMWGASNNANVWSIMRGFPISECMKFGLVMQWRVLIQIPGGATWKHIPKIQRCTSLSDPKFQHTKEWSTKKQYLTLLKQRFNCSFNQKASDIFFNQLN